VACAGDGDLYFVSGSELFLVRGGVRSGTRVHVAWLPAPSFELAQGEDESVWVWGRSNRQFVLFNWTASAGLTEVHRASKPISAVFAGQGGSVIFSVGRELFFRKMESAPTRAARIDRRVDGVASIDGTLLVSTSAGIMKFDPKTRDRTQVTSGIHGPMYVQGDGIYVLWREARRIVRLASTISPAPPAQ
jgi:hypothetical protein